MRVLYVSKALVVAEYRTKLLALAACGAEVVAMVPHRWGVRPVERSDGLGDALSLRPSRAWLHGRNHLHVYPGLGRILDEVQPDLVHIDEEPYSLVTFQAARLCRRRRIPSIFFAWQNLSKRLPPPFAGIRRAVYRAVSGGIAGTPAAARVLRGGGFEGPVAVIPQFGVDTVRFEPDPASRRSARAELGASPDDFVVGFGGRLVPEKGIDRLIRAAAAVPTARLLVAGEGPEKRKLQALSHEVGLAERTSFAGHLPSTSMPRWLSALDVLVLPSVATRGWAEQFGRILVEAMAVGVAVVASRSGEIPYVVGDAGLLVPEGETPALAAALRKLQAEPALRHELACRGRARVVERFSQDRIASLTLDFYDSLRGSAVPSPATHRAGCATMDSVGRR
jgi:glycosyltransferase involved in cell wall biosynthesis